MIQSYEDSIQHLSGQGWTQTNFGTYAKNGYEIVFDTSHYVELYKGKDNRLSESRIDSVQDLVRFLEANKLRSKD
jgi:hypothetical protein